MLCPNCLKEIKLPIDSAGKGYDMRLFRYKCPRCRNEFYAIVSVAELKRIAELLEGVG